MTGTSTRTSACCSSSPSASRAAVAAVGVSGAREASLQSILSESASCALASTAATHAPVLAAALLPHAAAASSIPAGCPRPVRLLADSWSVYDSERWRSLLAAVGALRRAVMCMSHSPRVAPCDVLQFYDRTETCCTYDSLTSASSSPRLNESTPFRTYMSQSFSQGQPRQVKASPHEIGCLRSGVSASSDCLPAGVACGGARARLPHPS